MASWLLSHSSSGKGSGPLKRLLACLMVPALAFLETGHSAHAVEECADYSQQMEWVTTLPVTDSALAITVENNLLYVADQSDGIRIFDLSTPSSPQFLNVFDTWGFALDFEMVNGIAYVADWVALAIVNLTDPMSPFVMDMAYQYGKLQTIDVEGEIAYLGTDRADLYAFNISNPSNAVLLGSYSIPGNRPILDIAAKGPTLYIAYHYDGLQIVDATNPSAMTLIDEIDYQGTTTEVAVEGNLLFVGSSDELSIFDVSEPASPLLIDSMEFYLNALHVEGSAVHTGSGWNQGLLKIDAADPTNAVPIGRIRSEGNITAITVQDEMVYVAMGPDGIGVVNEEHLSIPAVATCPTGSTFGEVYVAGQAAAVHGFFGSQVRFVSLENPLNPSLMGLFALPNSTPSIEFDGQYLFSMDNQGTLLIVDATDLAEPVLLSTLDLGNSGAGSLLADENLLWVCQWQFGLGAVDIADPSSPVLVGFLPSVFGDRMKRDGDLIYLAYETGVTVVDVSNPLSPTLLTTFPDVSFGSFEIAGDLLYSLSPRELKVWDRSNPLSLEKIGSIPLHDQESHLSLFRDRPFAVAGMEVIDLTNPTQPHVVGRMMTLPLDAGSVARAQPQGGYVYAAAGTTFHVFLPQCLSLPVSTASLPNSTFPMKFAPNPFMNATKITFSLPRNGFTELDILDVVGRRARRLVSEVLSAGTATFSWDGTNEARQPVAPGVYFVRLRTHDGTQTGKVILSK